MLFENQDQIDRILPILLAFLSPKQLLNLNTDKYSASSNYNSEFHLKIEPRVNQILQVLEFVSLILPHKKDVCEFFTDNILPLLSNINNAQILLALESFFWRFKEIRTRLPFSDSRLFGKKSPTSQTIGP